jgi:hypothetical protein
VLLVEVGAGSHGAFPGSDEGADHPVAVLASLGSPIGPVSDVTVGRGDHAAKPPQERVVADREREPDDYAMRGLGEPPANVLVDGEDFQLVPRVPARHDPQMLVFHWQAGALTGLQVEIEYSADVRARAESRAAGFRACRERNDGHHDADRSADGGHGSSAEHDGRRDRG